MVRCPNCDALVSEWAAACDRCGAGVGDAPLVAEGPGADVGAPVHRPPPGPVLVMRSPRRRALLAAAAAGVVALAGVGVWRATAPRPRRPRVATATDAVPFVPAVRHDGATTVLPITLLDGRRIELRYPSSLGIGQLGLTVGIAVHWPGTSACCWALVSASHATLAGAYRAAAPLATYRGGRVRLLPGGDRRLPGYLGSQNLVFQFGAWLVEVDAAAVGEGGAPPPMSAEDQRMWAASLDASSTSGGYLVLHPHLPLTIAPASVVARMSVTFGLGHPNAPQGDSLEIDDGYCSGPASDPPTPAFFRSGDGLSGAGWCDRASGLHISAVGRVQFVTAAASGFSLSAPR